MAKLLTRRWAPRFEGATRRDREGCTYQAYLPDSLTGWDLSLPGDLAADVADAETAVRDLNQAGASHVSLEGLARFLLRAESVASSRIEGLDAGARRLVDAEALLAAGAAPADRVAVEILGGIAAMESAIALAGSAREIGLTGLLGIHRTLLEHANTAGLGGVIRSTQNWIGGSSYNPCRASFIPPPPEHLSSLIADLIEYSNSTVHSPVVQAAIAHAQFETIHPFADGNGRAGRALVHVILKRRRLAPGFVPPVSLVLAARSEDYIAGLTAFRHTGPPAGTARSDGAHLWLQTFAAATIRACSDAERYASRIDALTSSWRDTLGPVRRGSALDLLLTMLPGVPLVTVQSAARLIGRSEVATGSAINRLAAAKILVQRNLGRQRYRVFESPKVLALFTALERALTNP